MKYITIQDESAIVNLDRIIVIRIQKSFMGGYNIIGSSDLNGNDSTLLGVYNDLQEADLIFNTLAHLISSNSNEPYFMPKRELRI